MTSHDATADPIPTSSRLPLEHFAVEISLGALADFTLTAARQLLWLGRESKPTRLEERRDVPQPGGRMWQESQSVSSW